MPKKASKGIVACEHDTPTPIHDELWDAYREHVRPPTGTNPNGLSVIAGPYHKDKVKNGKPRVESWVIIDLITSQDSDERKQEIAKAYKLVAALNKVGTDMQSDVYAHFEELEESTMPST